MELRQILNEITGTGAVSAGGITTNLFAKPLRRPKITVYRKKKRKKKAKKKD